VLPPRAGDLVRPLVRASRAAVEAHLARHAIPFARDPSNADPRFLRARVRHELLPLLRALSPGIDAHLCALADQLAEAQSADGDPLTLPRATRCALAELLTRPSTHTRVALPGGLVVTRDTLESRPEAPRNARK
jgi:tRNA(Ile)-lysidine synthase